MPRFTHLLTAAAVAALATASAAPASAVLDLTPDNFDQEILKSGKPALVEFFAPWCGHCKNLAPIYDELAAGFAFARDQVTVAKVDADQHKELGKKYDVQGFPTLKWFDGAAASPPEDYTGGRDLESLSAFITEKTGVKAKGPKKTPSAVEMLTDATFDEKIGKAQDALVAFTAPWCGHCKNLAPTWEKLAHAFASEPGVLIGKVNADAPNAKATAQRFEVTSYPTILYFARGSRDPQPYAGDRSEGALADFVNEKAGTFRTPAGTLNALAGIIPSLDAAVKALPHGGDRAYQHLYAQAAALQHRYAEYYAKVAHKAQANKDYIQKEATRLATLISKGNLAPAKLDDLISRQNILAVFQPPAAETETEAQTEKSEL